MAVTRCNPLFDGPRIGPCPQHGIIMVRLEHEHVATLQRGAHGGGGAPEIRRNPEPRAGRGVLECDGNGVGRIMYGQEWPDLEHANAEPLGGIINADVLFAGQQRETGEPRAPCQIERDAEPSRENTHAARVVTVVVRDDDAGDRDGIDTDSVQPRIQVAAAEAGIDEHARAVGLDERRVAGTAAAEDGYTHAFAAWRTARMRARRRRFVMTARARVATPRAARASYQRTAQLHAASSRFASRPGTSPDHKA